MTIAAILQGRGEVITATPAMRLDQLLTMLTEKRIGAVPVCDGDEIVGIMSERDAIRAIAGAGAQALGMAIAAFMTAPPITALPDTTPLAALSLMTKRRIRHLPIVDDAGAMIGFVSIGDLVKARIDHIEHEAEAMRAYIAS